MRIITIGLLGIIFLCGFTSTLPTPKFNDARDGVNYGVITIGDLQIMNNNLKFQNETAFCYEDLERYCNHFGKLYSFQMVVDKEANIKENICPKGWNIPTLEEWEYLILGMNPIITRDKNGEMNYTISKNYAQLQFGGFRSHQGGFYFNMGKEGHYMTSTLTEDGWATIKFKRQGKGYKLAVVKNTNEDRAVSCRCVKNK